MATSLPPQKQLSPQAIELVAHRFKLLGDPMRLTLLHALQSGEKSVNQLVEETGASQPNISKHLAALRNAGLVKRRKETNMAYFSIAAPFIFQLCQIVCEGINQEIEALTTVFNQ